jgi:flagellar L-ring protein precursor FlgH
MKRHALTFMLCAAASVQIHAQSATPRESLYSEGKFEALTSDRRQHKVGDLVSVIIFENSSASSSADTGANRDSSVGLTVVDPSISRSAALSTSSDFVGGVGHSALAKCWRS